MWYTGLYQPAVSTSVRAERSATTERQKADPPLKEAKEISDFRVVRNADPPLKEA